MTVNELLDSIEENVPSTDEFCEPAPWLIELGGIRFDFEPMEDGIVLTFERDGKIVDVFVHEDLSINWFK